MKKRKFFLTLVVFSSLVYFGSDLNVPPPVSRIEKSFPVKQQSIQGMAPLPQNFRRIQISSTQQTSLDHQTFPKKIIMDKTRPPKAFETIAKKGLPKGLKLAREIFAVKKSDYTKGLGKKIQEKDGLVYFQNDVRPMNVAHVAVEGHDGRLHAVSSIIKLSNVDEYLREKLLSKGLHEHYYSEELRVMFLQTTPEEVFELHSTLAKENLNPEIEVNRAYRKIR